MGLHRCKVQTPNVYGCPNLKIAIFSRTWEKIENNIAFQISEFHIAFWFLKEMTWIFLTYTENFKVIHEVTFSKWQFHFMFRRQPPQHYPIVFDGVTQAQNKVV